MENQNIQLQVVPANQNEEKDQQENFEAIWERIEKRDAANDWLKNPYNQVNALKYLSFSIKRNYNELKDERLFTNSMKLIKYNTNIANTFQYMLWLAGMEIVRKKGDCTIDTNHSKKRKHLNLVTLNESNLKNLYTQVKEWKKNLLAWNALRALGQKMAETPAIKAAIDELENAMVNIKI